MDPPGGLGMEPSITDGGVLEEPGSPLLGLIKLASVGAGLDDGVVEHSLEHKPYLETPM